jgi:RNA polymerase sigma-70 factor (ECF subfamily)
VAFDELSAVPHDHRPSADAFEALLTPHLDHAFRLACALSPDRAAAEDALQSASLKAWRKIDQLRDRRTFPWWFFKIVTNECRTSRRRRRWYLRPLHGQDMRAQDWPAGLEADSDVRRALTQLSPDDRAVLAVRYLLDMSVDDSARLLGISAPALKARSIRAAARLRTLLGNFEEKP